MEDKKKEISQHSELGTKKGGLLSVQLVEGTESCWRKSRGDHRFTSFAKSISINHAAWNIELKLVVPIGISTDRLNTLLNTTKALNQNYVKNKDTLNVASTKSMLQDRYDLRSYYLHLLRKRLKDTAFLKLNQLSLENEKKEISTSSKTKSKQKIPASAQLYFNKINSTFNNKCRLLSYCEGTKDLNVAFQHYIMNATPETIEIIRHKVIEEFDLLIFNKHGNYLLQRLVQKDDACCQMILRICINNFETFAGNEYSSRVMQVLIEVHPGFRTFVHSFFNKNIAFSYSKICVTFLLLIALRHSETSACFRYVYDHLKRDPGLYQYKLFKRVLIGYFQFADYSMIGEMWTLILTIEPFESFFDKKFSSLTLLMVIRRDHQDAIKQISWYLLTRFPKIIKRKYSKVMAEKLLQLKYLNFRESFNGALVAIKPYDLDSLRSSSEENFNFYLYITIASFQETQTAELEAYLRKIKQLFPTSLPHL